MAYAAAELPCPRLDEELPPLFAAGQLVETKVCPQIYFLTSGQPDGGARQTLDNLDVLDCGRKIPVNSIAFIQPADSVAKQFAKDLANKTGGFFHSIEQPSLHVKKRKGEPLESDAHT